MQGSVNNLELIATVVDTSSEGVVILSMDGQVMFSNPAFRGITGLEERELRGEKPAFLRSGEEGSPSHVWDSLRRNGTWCGEIHWSGSQDGEFPLWVTIQAVCDAADKHMHYIARFTDIKRPSGEDAYVATHDALTGLPNRVLFQDRLSQAINRARRYRTHGAVLFLDLDRFKKVNDSLGHYVGDDLLRQLGQRLRSLCRSDDTLARVGGDEFTLLAENLSRAEDAAIVAQNIVDHIVEPFTLSGYELKISASVGISVFPRDGEDVTQLIKQADSAMYHAKGQGANTYRFYTQELTNHAFEHFAMEVSLRKAIDRDEFFLEYQPQLDVASGDIVGIEALVRWQHPDIGRITPERFIPIAEVSGLIDSIGIWVLDEVCRQAENWEPQLLKDLVVTVNLSVAQLVKSNLVDLVTKSMRRFKTDPALIEFEITESAILEQDQIVYQNLLQLKRLGCRLSVDNFGAGYSSLVNLKRCGFDRLKIDKALIRDIDHDTDDEAIIRGVIALGKSMHLEVVAEGVETEAQYRFLLDVGCPQIQGFWFMPPIPPEETNRVLGKQTTPTNGLVQMREVRKS